MRVLCPGPSVLSPDTQSAHTVSPTLTRCHRLVCSALCGSRQFRATEAYLGGRCLPPLRWAGTWRVFVSDGPPGVQVPCWVLSASIALFR